MVREGLTDHVAFEQSPGGSRSEPRTREETCARVCSVCSTISKEGLVLSAHGEGERGRR